MQFRLENVERGKFNVLIPTKLKYETDKRQPILTNQGSQNPSWKHQHVSPTEVRGTKVLLQDLELGRRQVWAGPGESRFLVELTNFFILPFFRFPNFSCSLFTAKNTRGVCRNVGDSHQAMAPKFRLSSTPRFIYYPEFNLFTSPVVLLKCLHIISPFMISCEIII